jgi:two-component system, response regulator PdtaR
MSSTETPSARKSTILLVEDELLVRMSTAQELQDRGFHVVQAIDGASAVEYLKNSAIDLVFTDIKMPGQPDGLRLAMWIRERNPDLPIILTSGDHTAAEAARVLTRREIFVSKPYDIAKVSAQMRLLLGNR